MNWTNEQEAAISFPQKDGKKLPPDLRSATVTAAAGSGKTALLVERVIRILCDTENPVPADKLAIMTFTRNAAEEFRRRMTDAVAAAAKKDPKNTYLAEQLVRFKSAPISTINSFCLSILRENAEAFGLPVSFSIMDEAKSALLKANAIDATMEYFYSDEFNAKSRDLLFKTFSFRDDSSLMKAVSSTYENISSLSEPEKWLKYVNYVYSTQKTAEKHFLPYYISVMKRSLNGCRNYFESYSDIINDLPDEHPEKAKLSKMLLDDEEKLIEAEYRIKRFKYNSTLATVYKYLSQLGLNDKGVLRFAALSCKDELLKAMIEPSRNKFKALYKEMTACVPELAQMKAELPEQRITVKALVALISRYTEEYTKQKREAGYVDFSDCERLLLDKLRRDKVFCKQISERFRCIIVDEFQDTNDIQYEIFRLISSRENNLFFVGDIKQAIYAFRGGNPRIMLSLCDPLVDQRLTPMPKGVLPNIRIRNSVFPPKMPTARKIKSGCRVFTLGAKHTPLPLNKNFRSRQQVVDTVNAMFTGLMTQQYGDVDYNEQTKLICGAEYPEAEADYTSELHLLDYAEADDKVEAEAKYTAFLINKMIKEKFPVKQGDSTRPCEAGDFCILLRSSPNRAVFEEAIKQYGINVQKGESSNYLGSEEITLILNYLKVIDNPLRDEELLSVLMSPVYMMTAEELAEARLGVLGIDKEKANGADLTPLYEHYKNSTLFACISACARASDSTAFGAFSDELSEGELAAYRELRTEGHPKCVKFVKNLTAFRSFMANNSIERLIRKIYDDTDFFSVISTYERGEFRLANIRLLLKYAADFENNGGGTLGDFLRYTDNVREKNENFAEASLADSSENAVKIMTFHASKGLEMPIVILAELGKKPNNRDLSEAMVFNRSAGIGLRYVDIEQRYRYKPFGYNAIVLAEGEKRKSEELRLLYVAMTRAREKLIMVGKFRHKEIDPLRTKSFTPDFAMSEDSMISWIVASFLRYSGGALITEQPVMFGDGILKASITSKVPVDPAEQLTETPQLTSLPDDESAIRIAAAINAEYQHQADTAARSKFTVTEIAHMIDELHDPDSSGGMVFMSKPSFAPKGSLTGKEVGDAYHHVMEHFPVDEIISGQDPDTAFVIEVLKKLRERDILDDAELKAVKPQHIEAFFRSELGQRMLNSRRIEREYPIFAEVPARDIYVQQDGMTIIQGRADMFFYDDDGIVLVDYKSDTKENLEKELEAYSRQLAIYRTILPVMTGVRVKEIYIYSFSCDMAVKV